MSHNAEKDSSKKDHSTRPQENIISGSDQVKFEAIESTMILLID